MSITSLSFIFFIFIIFSLYYILPHKYQWVLLLFSSIIFYLSNGCEGFLFVLITSLTIYVSTNRMDFLSKEQNKLKTSKENYSKEELKKHKKIIKNKRNMWMIASLIINVGLLCFFKYFHFALEQVNALLNMFDQNVIDDTFEFIVPLGISFYTFQSLGYLLNVYWEKIDVEKNYFRLLLFISFFPQITQGPISEYNQLSSQLFANHNFEYKNYSWGCQRLVWGYFKKMVIANQLGKYVKIVFQNYSTYTGVSALIGAFLYSIQIYADFSGYMDIMCGFCETLGIKLTENFNRPYFSKSVAEYWRRWHISLGAWFKNYIYYPIGMSKWNRKLAKITRKRFGKHFANTFPATIALLVVWTVTGLWHGANWSYIVWGIVNGLFIIFDMWMQPIYERLRNIFKIDNKNFAWKLFRVCRTFLLVTLIKILPEVGTLKDGLGLCKQIIFNHNLPSSIQELFPYLDMTNNLPKLNFLIVVLGIFIMLLFSVVQRKKPVREYYNSLPFFFRILIISIAIIFILSFGVRSSWEFGGFMYENF